VVKAVSEPNLKIKEVKRSARTITDSVEMLKEEELSTKWQKESILNLSRRKSKKIKKSNTKESNSES